MNLLTNDQKELIKKICFEDHLYIGKRMAQYENVEGGMLFTLVDRDGGEEKTTVEYSEIESFLGSFINPSDMDEEESPGNSITPRHDIEDVKKPAKIKAEQDGMTVFQQRLYDIVKSGDKSFSEIKREVFKKAKTHPSAGLRWLVDNAFVVKVDDVYRINPKNGKTKAQPKKPKPGKKKKVNPIVKKTFNDIDKINKENEKRNQELVHDELLEVLMREKEQSSKRSEMLQEMIDIYLFKEE